MKKLSILLLFLVPFFALAAGAPSSVFRDTAGFIRPLLTTDGFMSTASSTIGGGATTTGLTIFGGATTTKSLYVTGVGTSTFTGAIGLGTTTPTLGFNPSLVMGLNKNIILSSNRDTNNFRGNIQFFNTTDETKTGLEWYDHLGNSIAWLVAHYNNPGASASDHTHLEFETSDLSGQKQGRFTLEYGCDYDCLATFNQAEVQINRNTGQTNGNLLFNGAGQIRNTGVMQIIPNNAINTKGFRISTSTADNDIAIDVTSGTELEVLDNINLTGSEYISGSLGIGTTSPNQQLTIEKSGASGTVNGPRLALRQNQTSINATTNSNVGEIYFEGADILDGEEGIGAKIRGQAANPWNGTTNDYPTDLLFFTQPDGGATGLVERLRILHSGNVGVGTTSPFGKLSVHANNGDTNRTLFAIGSSTVSATTTLLSVLNTGEVGFNTSAPTALVNLGGTYTTSNASLFKIDSTISSSVTGIVTAMDFSPTLIGTGAVSSYQGFSSVPRMAGSVTPVSLVATGQQIIVDASYGGGNVLVGRGVSLSNPVIQKAGISFTTFEQVLAAGVTNGDSITSGTVTNILYDTTASTASTSAGGTINNYGARLFTPSGSPNGGTTNNRALFITGNGGSTLGGTVNNYALYNDSTAKNYFAGNVGIGTTTPWGSLSVTNVGTNPSLIVEDSASPDTTPFIVDASGQVGIGTSTPAAQLDINALGGGIAVIFRTNAANGFSGFNLYDSSNVLKGSVVYEGTSGSVFPGTLWIANRGTVAGNDLVFATNNISERMRITLAGNVGIGTTTPQWLLNPTSATASQLALSAGAGVAQWAFRNAGGNLYLATTTVAGTATTSLAAFSINGTTGNIGIGTSSPTYKLSVEDSQATNPLLYILNNDTSNAGNVWLSSKRASTGGLGIFRFLGFDTNGVEKQFAGLQGRADTLTAGSYEGSLAFLTASAGGAISEKMRVTGTGNVGISTTSPFATFSVVGSSNSVVAIATSTTAGSNTPIYQIDKTGHVIYSGPLPTCNANCTFIAGNDNAFRVRLGAAVTTATVTFANTWGTIAPICVANEGDAGTVAVAASSTPTTVVLTALSSLSNKDAEVLCMGVQ